MRVTINGKDAGWAVQGLLQRLLRSDPNQKLQNGDTDITEAEARALLDQDSNQDIDEQDLQKINQGFTTQNEQMAAADLVTLAETFQRSFPKTMPSMASSLFQSRANFIQAQRQPPLVNLKDQNSLAIASFHGVRDSTGCIDPNQAPQGILLVNARSFKGSSLTVQRTFLHELTHQRWDRMDPDTKQKVIDAFQKHYSMDECKKYLLQLPNYKKTYEAILAQNGQEAADARVMDECVAYMLQYSAIPPTRQPLVNEPSPERMAVLLRIHGSEKKVREYFAEMGLPWHPAKTKEDVQWLLKKWPDMKNEDFEPINLRVSGLEMKSGFYQVAKEAGLVVSVAETDKVITMARQVITQQPSPPSTL